MGLSILSWYPEYTGFTRMPFPGRCELGRRYPVLSGQRSNRINVGKGPIGDTS